MSTFRLKRKTFSDQPGEKKSGLGKKLLIGAGIAAAGFAGAKTGMLGAGAQKWAGSTYGKVGKMIGSEGMMLSGAKSYGQGAAKQIANNRDALIKAGKTTKTAYTNDQITKNADKLGNAFLGKLLK